MIEDEQTHTLPESEQGVAHVACFMGYPDAERFAAALTATLRTVQGNYARLFEREPELASAQGSGSRSRCCSKCSTLMIAS